MTRILLPALALIALAGAASPSPAFGQSSPPPAAPPGPATQGKSAPAAAGPKRTVTLTPERPGTYSYWVVQGGSGQGSVATLNPGDASARVALTGEAESITVLDETTGLTASKPVRAAKDGAAVKVSPSDFTKAHAVVVRVTAGGKPVEKASVTLKDAKGGGGSRVLTAGDNGSVIFNDIALGKATVTATYGANDSETATQETNIVPAKGGGPVEVALALSGNVPTLDAPAATGGSAAPGTTGTPGAPTIVVQPATPAAEPEPRNDWVSGIIGILLLIGGAFFGMRYLKNRGMTVTDAIQSGLKSVGAEMPQDAPGANGVGHLKPAAPSLPPLPSLNDLPSGGTASPSVTLAGAPAAVAVPANLPGSGPRLIGMAGAVSGEIVNLEAAEVTVGRDAANSLPLPLDTTVSRRHARFAPGGSGGWEVVDEGSSNGTYVNGRKTDRQTLQPGDEVQIGSARFRFEV
ncbi:MAG TPA: FHA domain-containing protein [Armatimonadaceae bacterium]|nr:FHA domain-containing protein [Armatimonadaceae bacterium]